MDKKNKKNKRKSVEVQESNVQDLIQEEKEDISQTSENQDQSRYFILQYQKMTLQNNILNFDLKQSKHSETLLNQKISNFESELSSLQEEKQKAEALCSNLNEKINEQLQKIEVFQSIKQELQQQVINQTEEMKKIKLQMEEFQLNLQTKQETIESQTKQIQDIEQDFSDKEKEYKLTISNLNKKVLDLVDTDTQKEKDLEQQSFQLECMKQLSEEKDKELLGQIELKQQFQQENEKHLQDIENLKSEQKHVFDLNTVYSEKIEAFQKEIDTQKITLSMNESLLTSQQEQIDSQKSFIQVQNDQISDLQTQISLLQESLSQISYKVQKKNNVFYDFEKPVPQKNISSSQKSVKILKETEIDSLFEKIIEVQIQIFQYLSQKEESILKFSHREYEYNAQDASQIEELFLDFSRFYQQMIRHIISYFEVDLTLQLEYTKENVIFLQGMHFELKDKGLESEMNRNIQDCALFLLRFYIQRQ